MIDGVPEVSDLVPSGLAIAERDDAGRTVYRLLPEGQARITAALTDRGRAARAASAGPTAIVCGGTPSEHDREVIRQFGAALVLPTKDEQRAAVLALQDRGRA